MESQLKIVVVDADKDRSFMIVDGLREAGDYHVTVLDSVTGIARRLKELQPDIILIDLESPSRDSFEQIITATGPLERPVAMFVDQSDSQMMKSAIEAGVSAYVVNGLRKNRIKPVIETAMVRFHKFARLKAELDATKTALSQRKQVDRAKGLLMKMRGLSEEEAYALLRKTAMDKGMRIPEVAQGIITAVEVLL
ncbi:MAG: ANTAR domain-containing protein [Rhodobacteraceae bacterium]|nr:ANTAR domain-containing protein [Paracoccaceae bacterium]